MSKELLRNLPKVDKILGALENHPIGRDLPEMVRLNATRSVLDEIREGIKSGRVNALPDFDAVLDRVAQLGRDSRKPGLRRVINATGVVLHTNLGRAPLGDEIAEAVKQVAVSYCALEYDLQTGKRGARGEDIERLLVRLTGCEAAIVVNNNAAAVLLALSAICAGGRVLCSRGELVEIGGAFRVPEVISQGGAILTEVGTTNKTRLTDYATAIDDDTAAILKVHTSNYQIVGFTESTGLAQLALLAQKHDIPLIYDLGGGALVCLHDSEPLVPAALADGVDLLCFSGDKLLGGPQAGIIIGRAVLISRLKAHPLYRALRLDKLSMAALEVTLRLYDEGQAHKIPTVNMLSQSMDELYVKAKVLLEKLSGANFHAEIIKTTGRAGGGSLPCVDFPSYVVAITSDKYAPHELEACLRAADVPIIGRIYQERLILDVRTIGIEDFNIISQEIHAIKNKAQEK